MTTATAQRPPTEDEIRAAIEARWEGTTGNPLAPNQFVDEALREIINHVLADPLIDSAADTLERDGGSVWEPLKDPRAGAIWTDLRPLEAARLVDLTREACDRAEQRCRAIIVEELTAAGVQFASEHPEAPRAG